MQRPSIRPPSRQERERLSRGVPPSRRLADEEAAFLDGVDPTERLVSQREMDQREIVNPRRSLNGIAVVVGSKKQPARDSRPAVREAKPMARDSHPVMRDPRPAYPRLPALPGKARAKAATVSRKAAGSVAVLKRAYGAVFNPEDRRHDMVEAEQDGLKSYLLQSFESQRRSGGRVLAIALVIGGGWATLVPLSGAVVVPGTVVSESSVKKIQHPTGGIIAGISVTDGKRVRQGDVLVRLDDTQVRSNFQVVSKQLEEVRARLSRLSAERDGHEEPASLTSKPAARDRAGDGEQLLTSEKTLFNARAESRKSQRELLRTRIAQLNDEIAGMESQIKSKQAQSDLFAQELEGVQQLWDKRLTPLQRLTSLQREAARLGGEKGQLQSNVAETRGKISEAELQLVKLDQDFRADVMKDLREAQDKEAELIEKVVAAKDQVAHIDLRAPVTGTVHQLAVHTVGGVVTPAEVLAVIVPESDELEIDAHLPSDKIDQVHKGQNAQVHFPAFNQRTTPELTGIVSYVSADISHDQQQPNGPGYYTVRVNLPPKESARLGDQQLIAGMPAELFIEASSRTMMSYMFKPITDQLGRMFRER
jgi:HlyD family secretion protein